MKPAPFEYVRPSSRRDALALLADDEREARVLAGGQSLMAMLNMRVAAPGLLVDIAGLEELAELRLERSYLAIGATVRQAELERRASLAGEVPLLPLALPHVGHFQTRNRGTVCGSIAHADPSAELPLCLTTLGGEVVLESRRGRRALAAEEFFAGMLLTARRDDELITEVRFPLRDADCRYAFTEVAMRHGDFALVALAAVVRDGHARLGVGGVADRPMVREIVLDGTEADALNAFAWELGAQDDHHASAAYRRTLVRELGQELIGGIAA